MFRKVFLTLIVIGCMASTYKLVEELSSKNIKLTASQYFSKEDKEIYAISFPSNLNLETEKIQTTALNKDLFNSLSSRIPDNCTLYMSQKRGVVVFESSYEWTQSSIKELFLNGKHKVNFTGYHQLTYGSFKGSYAQNILVLNTESLDTQDERKSFKVDKKASHSIVRIDSSGVKVTDFYRKDLGIISYQTKEKIGSTLENIDDRSIFSDFVPSYFDSYTFYEKGYLKACDSIYRSSEFSEWTHTGILLLQKNNSKYLIIDMKEGQKALENMNDLNNDRQSNENFGYFKNIQIASFFGSEENKGVYISDVQGYAILARDKALFDQIATEITLGKAIRENKSKMKRLYGVLPKKVLFRKSFLNGTTESIVSSGDRWVETKVKETQEKVEQTDDTKGYFAMNPSEKISSFYAYSGRGNTFLVTESNKWIRYENGKRMWEKTFDRKVVREPKLMEMSTDKNQDISILFENEALIVDKAGRILNRFPTSGGVHPIRFRLKGALSFLIPNTNTITVTDNDGRTKSVYTFSSPIVDMVLFKELNRKYVGVLCQNTFFVIDLEQKRTKRKIQLETSYELLKSEGASVIMSESQDHTIDIFGNRSELKTPEGFKYMQYIYNGTDLELLFAKENELITLNKKGQFIGQKTLDIASIDKIAIFSKEDRSTQIGVLDGIENKIVLLDSKDLSVDKNIRHGEKNLQLTSYDHRGISITTFLGDILIQYTKF